MSALAALFALGAMSALWMAVVAGLIALEKTLPWRRTATGFTTTALLVLGVLLLFAVIVSIGFGALGAFAALRTGSGEAVQGLFPLFFVFLFISSMNMPRNLIAVDWFRTAATLNPVSYLIECVRSLIIIGWDGEALALGFGVATLIAVTAVTLASVSLRTRLTRS